MVCAAGPCHWVREQTVSQLMYVAIKSAQVGASMMVHLPPDAEVNLAVDASIHQVGSVLHQKSLI